MASKLDRFGDIVTTIEVAPYDGDSDLVTTCGFQVIEPKGKYRNGSTCRIQYKVYEISYEYLGFAHQTQKEIGYSLEMTITPFN